MRIASSTTPTTARRGTSFELLDGRQGNENENDNDNDNENENENENEKSVESVTSDVYKETPDEPDEPDEER